VAQRVEPRETEVSACANTRDGPGATPEPAPRAARRGSNHGSRSCGSTATGWRACWPDDRPGAHSSVGDPRSGSRQQNTPCNNGTCVESVGDSCPQKGKQPAPLSTHPRLGKKTQDRRRKKTFQPEFSKKTQALRRRIFKPPVSPRFHSAPHNENPRHSRCRFRNEELTSDSLRRNDARAFPGFFVGTA
jgi:hypothetical protein